VRQCASSALGTLNSRIRRTDDGPSPYTPRLLNLLESQGLKSTFFIVGSRAISRPEMVQTEYMLGHQCVSLRVTEPEPSC